MDLMDSGLTQPAKLLLLAALLAKDNVISQNSKSFLKELALRRDDRLVSLLADFESKQTEDAVFLEKIHDAIEQESELLYKDIFHDTPTDLGKQLSREERHEKGLDEAKSLIYGEVEYHSFYQVLRKINPNLLQLEKNKRLGYTNNNNNNDNGFVFYDLGSGTGKAVILARILYDFSVCVGIELLEKLYVQSKVIEERFNTHYRSTLTAGRSQAVEMHHDSLLEFDWSDGDVVFANSTCFDDDLMEEMSRRADNLAPGTVFVTFTKGLPSDHLTANNNNNNSNGGERKKAAVPTFELLDRKRYKMSWGPATVFIHRRLELDGTPVKDGYRLSYLPCDNISYDDETSLASVSSDDSDEGEEEDSDSNSDSDSDGVASDDDIITHHYRHQQQQQQQNHHVDDPDSDSDTAENATAASLLTEKEYEEMYEYYKQLQKEKKEREEEEEDSNDSDGSDDSDDSDYVPGQDENESDGEGNGSSEYEESESDSDDSDASEESMTGSSDSDSNRNDDNYQDDDEGAAAMYQAYQRGKEAQQQQQQQQQEQEQEQEQDHEAARRAFHQAETHFRPTHEQLARAVFHDNETHYPPHSHSQSQSHLYSPSHTQKEREEELELELEPDTTSSNYDTAKESSSNSNGGTISITVSDGNSSSNSSTPAQSPQRSSPARTNGNSNSNNNSPSRSKQLSSSPAKMSPYTTPSFVSPTKPIIMGVTATTNPNPNTANSHLPSAINTHGHHNMHHVTFSPTPPSSSTTSSGMEDNNNNSNSNSNSNNNSPMFMHSPMDSALLKRKHAIHPPVPVSVSDTQEEEEE